MQISANISTIVDIVANETLFFQIFFKKTKEKNSNSFLLQATHALKGCDNNTFEIITIKIKKLWLIPSRNAKTIVRTILVS